MLQERTGLNFEDLGQHIRAACERVDSLSTQRGGFQQQEKLSEAFEDLFVLLEELRLVEKELRVKDEDLMSMREIMDIERERYQELFEHAPDAYLLTDPYFRIQQFNFSSAELFQIQNEGLLGLTLMLFIDELDHKVLREQISNLKEKKIIKGIELRLQPQKGSVIYALITVGAIHNPEGSLTGIHWFLRDVTAQKEAEKALQLSEERFRSIAASARDAIIVADDKSTILSWNKGAEQIFQFSENEMIGKPLDSLVSERFKESGKGLQLSHILQIVGKTSEMSGMKKDGADFPMEISLSAWHANGNDYYTGIIRDITERKQADETRIRLLERILSGQEEDRRWIARELHDETGQSLSALLVGLRIIEEARTLKKAKLEASRLRSITAQTLDDVGRLAKGLRPIILDDLGLIVALKRHVSDFARSFNISIDFKSRGVDSERLPLTAETALFRISQEALTNIAKHSGAKNVHFFLEQNENEILLSIEDNGRGFEVEKALKASTASNHLGIHGMRERASLLGGTLFFESSPNKGTKVLVRLPKDGL